jgi:hypothetical protein
MGAGFIIIGQAIFNPFADMAERMLGGGVLFVAAYLIVRWTFRLLGEVRSMAADDRDAAVEREKLAADREDKLLERIRQMSDQNAELNAQLAGERQMRVALEQSGLSERRHQEREG